MSVCMSASQLVSAVGPVGVKHCDLHPISLLWKILAATLLPVCSVNRNPLQRVEKIHVEDRLWYFLGNKLTKRNLWAPEKCFQNLFVCLIAYIPTFRKFWGLGNKLMVKKQNKTRAKTSSMMWFRSPCVNECCASWEKKCLIYELTFCRRNASFEREKLYSAWLDFLL